MSSKSAWNELLPIARKYGLKEPSPGPSAAYELQTQIISKLRSEQSEARGAFRDAASESYQKELGRECDDSCVEDLLQICRVGPDRAQVSAPIPELISPTRGLSWQANVASGLAAFLEDRAEAELTQWVVGTLQSDLCEPPTDRWFSATCVLVRRAGEYRANVPALALAAALRQDLRSAPGTLLKRNTPDAAVAIRVLEGVLEKLQTGDAPLGLLAGLSEANGLKIDCAEAHEKRIAVDSLSCQLIDIGRLIGLMGDVLKPGVERAAELEMMADKLRLYGREFCGRDLHGTAPQPPDPFCQRLASVTRAELVPVLADAYVLTQKLREWQGDGKDADGSERSKQLMQMTLAILDGTMPIFASDNVDWPHIRAGLVVMGAFSRGSFADAFGGLAKLEDDLVKESRRKKTRKPQLPPAFYEHGTLLLNLATAQSGADVEGALAAAAAPVGSWRTKRRRPTISTTGLIGGGAGVEIPTEFDARPLQQELPAHAAASAVAAVGIDFSWPVEGWSVGAFVSLLDVGQLLSLPINPRTSKRAGVDYAAKAGTDLEAAQILSPGVFARVGVGDTPLTLASGVSIAPILRQYERTDPDTGARLEDELFTVIRVQVLTIGVDVTILPFEL